MTRGRTVDLERRVLDAVDALLRAQSIEFETWGPLGAHVCVQLYPSGLLNLIHGDRPWTQFRPLRKRAQEVGALVDALRALGAAQGDAPSSRIEVFVRFSRARTGKIVPRELRSAGARPLRSARRRTRGPDLTPWRLGALHGPCPRELERVPADIADACEPSYVLRSLVEEPNAVTLSYRARVRNEVFVRRRIGTLDVPSGSFVAAEARVPIRRRPIVLTLPAGAYAADTWSALPRGACPSALVLARDGAAPPVAWALAGNPSRRIQRSPWAPEEPSWNDLGLVGDVALVHGLGAVWAGEDAGVRRVADRLDRLGEHEKPSLRPGFTDGAPNVLAWPMVDAPRAYVGFDSGGTPVAAVLLFEGLVGGRIGRALDARLEPAR